MGVLLRKSLVWGLFVCLTAGVYAQQKATFKVTGPCMACGTDRMVGIVKALDGVASASYDAPTASMTVNFDPVSASLIDIQLELSINGYDAGDFKHDANAKLPDCARGGMRGDQAADDDLGIDDIDGLEKDTDWENPDAFEIVGTSGDDDLDIIGDDEDDDSDLSTFAGDNDDEIDIDVDDEEDDDDSDDQ